MPKISVKYAKKVGSDIVHAHPSRGEINILAMRGLGDFPPFLPFLLHFPYLKKKGNENITLIAGNHPRFNDMDITPYGY